MQLGILLDDDNWIIKADNIVLANYLLSKIKLILKIQIGSWLYDPSFGSNIPQLNQSRQRLTTTQLKQLMSSAFKPLVDNQEISNINIDILPSQIGVYNFDIQVTDITGNYFKFTYKA